MRYSVMMMSLLLGCEMSAPIGDSGSASEEPSAQDNEPSDVVWVQIRSGACEVEISEDGGVTWALIARESVSDASEVIKVQGFPNTLMQVNCFGEYGPAEVIVDPNSCPKVYCNPWGGTNKSSGEADACGNDTWFYAYPESDYQGDRSECGPWNMP